MPDVLSFFELIDDARVQRAKELSEIKRTFAEISRSDPLGIASKSAIVLCYAAWEGFYNECVRNYLTFLQARKTRVSDVSWLLLTGAMTAEFQSLKDRHHSELAKRSFVERLKERLNCGFDTFDQSSVMAQSNLDFCKLSGNFILLGLDISPFMSSRLKIDTELVGWRHGVAHGDPPDLRALDLAAHVDFASQLLLKISDSFQSGALRICD